MNKQHILDEIRRTAEQNGGVVLGRQRFMSETGIRESDWIGRYWSKWSDAVREAGCKPNTKQTAFGEDWLLEKIASLTRELGHFPTAPEVRLKARCDCQFPSHNVFARFGSKAQLASALVTWCERSPGHEDVQAICAPLAVSHEATDHARAAHVEPVIGYVYLLNAPTPICWTAKTHL